jgi:integrase
MKQKIKRVKRLSHLYERSYQTAAGEWRSKYYGIFSCKKWGKRRVFPLGGDLDVAKKELAQLLAENLAGKDFDAPTEPAKQGITFREWGQSYFASKVDPEKHAGGVEREKRSFKTLEPFFGDMLLSEIRRTAIMEYRAKRLNEPIMRRGKPAMIDGAIKNVSFPTVNRELAFLRYLLNMAEDDGIIDAAPRMNLKTEKDRKRERVASDEEYKSLLANMRRPAQRVLIALYESAMRLNEAVQLPWAMVDEKAGFIRLPAAYVKEKKKRTIPISSALKAVLVELKEEQKKVSNISNRVFTRNGRPIKSIRKAFELASEKAKIEDLRIHDFRHTCITRWSVIGIPQQAIMAASGHHSIQQNNAYVNMKDNHLRDAFKNYTPVIQAPTVENQTAASY